MSIWMKLNATSWIPLNLKGIYYGKRKSIFMKLLTKPSTTPNWLTILSLSRQTVWTYFLNIDNHICGIKFIDIEIEELIDKLCYRFSVLLLWHIELLDDLVVLLEEGICFIHAINLFVDIFRWVIMSSSFWVELLNAYRIVYGLLPLVSKESFL